MKHERATLAVVVLALCFGTESATVQAASNQDTNRDASGQSATNQTPANSTAAQVPASPIAEILRRQWQASRRQMVAITDAMPEDKFGFRPVDEVRSYGEIVAHFAGENQTYMEILSGVANPKSEEEFNILAQRYDKLKTKAEMMRVLTETYDYGDKVLAGWDDAKAMGALPQDVAYGGGTPRWFMVIGDIGHTKEHYGNLVTYLRLNHIVPPASR